MLSKSMVALRGATRRWLPLPGGKRFLSDGQSNGSKKKNKLGWKKHLVWITPVVGSLVTATTILNSKWVKEFVETYISRYFVDLVRDKYGFAEEKLDEEEALERTMATLAAPLDAIITYQIEGNGVRTVVCENVEGTTLYSDLVNRFVTRKEEINAEEKNKLQILNIHLTLADPLAASTLGVIDETSSDYKYSKKALYAKQLKHKRDAMGDVMLSPSLLDSNVPYSASLWHATNVRYQPLPSMDALHSEQTELIRYPGGTTGPWRDGYIRKMPQAYMITYQNQLASWLRGLRQFRRSTGFSKKDCNAFEVFAEISRARASLGRRRLTQKQSAEAAKKSGSSNRDDDRAVARERVDALTAKLQDLKREVDFGRRDMDEVEREMNAARAEIQLLNRQYFNWFYFF